MISQVLLEVLDEMEKVDTGIKTVGPEIHWRLQFATYSLGSSLQFDGRELEKASIQLSMTRRLI